ncbi:fibronectin type III domain-containing protein [Microbacterium fluvii]|uniref:Fibronectin type III domain-containing protein n=1 Tax=Microbacterium fluvii TaxID=415215 RepID=A0ABW2HE55_9MICO|nr:fibronectin type III domain-containing protein [Microbacterium fluvii]MCU4671674.1 fibronectin type III domain-containing protein [Microbacterium fluvii]
MKKLLAAITAALIMAGTLSLTPVAAVADDAPPASDIAVAPDAPFDVVATAADAAATVSWSAPEADGGAPITSYTVTTAPGGSTTTTDATSTTVTGLTNGTEYTFTVTATNEAGTSAASVASSAVTPLFGTPLSTSTPKITGTAVVGGTLTVGAGTWVSGTSLTYQWMADASPIEGATSTSFTITSAQRGAAISVAVTGTKTGYAALTRTSASTTRPPTVGAPTISGYAAYGLTLTAKPGTWTTGTSFAYQWYANGTTIPGATKATFKIGAAQKAKKISVKVTGTKSGFTTASKTSAATAKATTSSAAKVTGTAVVGAKLKATTGSWLSGTKLSYRWYADGVAISGATKSTYTVGSAQKSKKISVKITGEKSGYATVVRTSASTLKVAKVATPSISGAAKVTKTLTAKTGTWTAGTSFTYQWYANGKAISGAKKSTLKLSSAVVGKKITVKVTGKKSGHPTVSKTSKATAAVAYPSSTAPASEWNCPSWAPIKGNADSGIYHMPGQRYYNATKPEECFRTQSAAVAAGYRKAKV